MDVYLLVNVTEISLKSGGVLLDSGVMKWKRPKNKQKWIFNHNMHDLKSAVYANIHSWCFIQKKQYFAEDVHNLDSYTFHTKLRFRSIYVVVLSSSSSG